jgi:hypothetical protein
MQTLAAQLLSDDPVDYDNDPLDNYDYDDPLDNYDYDDPVDNYDYDDAVDDHDYDYPIDYYDDAVDYYYDDDSVDYDDFAAAATAAAEWVGAVCFDSCGGCWDEFVLGDAYGCSGRDWCDGGADHR